MSFYDDASLVFLPSGGAGKDGKAYSIKPVEELGSELVTNGGFDTDSDWTKGTGWTISGGAANCDGTQTTNSLLYQNLGDLSNKTIKFTFTISGYSAGQLSTAFFGAAGTQVENVSANGTYTFNIDVQSGHNGNTGFTANSSFIGSVDNVSVKEVIVDGDFTFSRGINLTATRVDSNGLIEKGRENLLENSVWDGVTTDTKPTGWTFQLVSGTGTFDVTATEGQIRFQTLDASSRAFIYSPTITTNGIVVASVYVDEVTTAMPLSDLLTRSANATTLFAYEDGVQINYYSDNVQAGKRYSVVFNKTASTNFRFGVGVSSGTLGDVVLSRPQIEVGLVATEWITSPVGSTGLAGILEDSPRFDYSGGASCPSLLLEPSRTNSIKQSEYINGWNFLSNVNVIDNAATSPEGVLNASKIIPTTAAGSQKVLDVSGFNRTSGEYISHTIYAKANGYNYLYLSNSADRLFAVYDLSGGSVDYVSSNGTDFINHSASIESVGNGWYRCALIGEAVTSIGSYLRLSVAPTSETTSAPAYTADGTSGILVYGAQVELNASYPTSYIPNHSGGSVTRNGEQIVNTNISSIINTSNSYTIFFDFTRPNADYVSAWQLIGIDNGGYTSRLKIVQRPNFDQFRVNVYDGTTNATSSEIDNSAQNKIAVVYDGSTSYKIFTNGTLLQTLSCGAINGTRLTSGENGTQKTIDNYQQISLFPTALSNTDCEILTGTSYESFAAMATALNYTTYE
jgi:hypothetical protein